jgi:biotin synthase-like enzyme
MIFKPIYEFLLWNNCNNNCKFCFQRKDPRLYNLFERENILKKTI